MHICSQKHNSRCIQKTILNSFVLSHVQYYSVLLPTINLNFITTLEKQLNWAIKSCFHRQKFDSSSDLEMNLVYYLFCCFLLTGLPLTVVESWIKRSMPSQAQLWSYQQQVFIYTSELKKHLPKQFLNAICMKKVLLGVVLCSKILSQETICQCHTVLQRRKKNSFFLTNTRRTRRNLNLVQLFGNNLRSFKILSFYYWINVTVLPPH